MASTEHNARAKLAHWTVEFSKLREECDCTGLEAGELHLITAGRQCVIKARVALATWKNRSRGFRFSDYRVFTLENRHYMSWYSGEINYVCVLEERFAVKFYEWAEEAGVQ